MICLILAQLCHAMPRLHILMQVCILNWLNSWIKVLLLNCYGFMSSTSNHSLNPLGPRQNDRRFADDTFKRIFLSENVRISIKISLKFVPKGPINNIPALVQIMAWRRSGDKPLSEPMMVSLLTHICVTRPQWVKLPLKWPIWNFYKSPSVQRVKEIGLCYDMLTVCVTCVGPATGYQSDPDIGDIRGKMALYDRPHSMHFLERTD